jgi:3-methyladenine DNA glycosylase AlkC
MALIDHNEELGSVSELDAEDFKQSQQTSEQTKQQPEAEQAPEIPEKYKGKNLEDIVRMHQEAEKLIGRQAQEVGEVRRLADELLKQSLAQKNQQAQPQKVENPPQEIDFFEDPQSHVNRAVANHPDVLAAKQASMQLKQIQTQAMLNKKHPDFANIVSDGEFIEWVKASPMRLNIYAMADANYDFNAADELITTFKQIRTSKTQQTTEAGNAVRKQNLKAAGVDVGGTGESSKKVYRRADLIRLRMTDPDRYEALQPEIMAAYQEGRVK